MTSSHISIHVSEDTQVIAAESRGSFWIEFIDPPFSASIFFRDLDDIAKVNVALNALTQKMLNAKTKMVNSD